MKESKQADELNKRLAELVAKDWREIASSESETSLLRGDISQNGSRGDFQPSCFHNLSHCSAADVCSTTKVEVELEERLENKDVEMEMERKRRLAEVGQVRKRKKEENCEVAKHGETFSQEEAEKVLLSIVGAGDSENVFKLMSSLSQAFDFRSCSTSAGSPCNIPKDSLLELASVEESFVGIKRMYPTPYSASKGSGVVELRCETSSVDEERQQREVARLKEQLAKDGDLEKYLRGKEKLLDELKQKNRGDMGHDLGGAGADEEEEEQREEARLKEQLARDCDLEKYQREKKKILEMKQKRKDGSEVCSPIKNGVKETKVENQSELTEVEKVQKEIARAKERLSEDKDAQEYKRQKKIIFRGALDRLKKQLLKDGNMKSYLAQKKLIDGINY